MEQRITICTLCRHKGTSCRPGYELIKNLQNAINSAGDTVSDDFMVSGVACVAGCDRPCTIAYHGSRKATYLFGDIDPQTDIDDLVDFAKQHAQHEDGWCSSLDRPCKLGATLARAPAAIVAIEQTVVRPS